MSPYRFSGLGRIGRSRPLVFTLFDEQLPFNKIYQGGPLEMGTKGRGPDRHLWPTQWSWGLSVCIASWICRMDFMVFTYSCPQRHSFDPYFEQLRLLESMRRLVRSDN